MSLRVVVFFLLLGVAIGAPSLPGLFLHWAQFKEKFNKHYPLHEELARRSLWLKRIMAIIHHNLQADLGNHPFRLGINEFADLTDEEFRKTLNGFRMAQRPRITNRTFVSSTDVPLPDTVDWRKEDMVTPVMNQMQCGSCWVISATGALQGQQKKKTNQLVALSVQNLLDCSKAEGCSGGDMNEAFEYVQKNKGIATEMSYPYVGQEGPCKFRKEDVGATCTGYVDLPPGDEEALKTAVATVGPVSVAIDASDFSFQAYSGGVYDNPLCNSTEVDHGVLVVGYGTQDGKDYWLIKNSWGTTWGLDGYGMMARNKNNQCGIATMASYPLV